MFRWITFYAEPDQLRDPVWRMLVGVVWLGVLALVAALAGLAIG